MAIIDEEVEVPAHKVMKLKYYECELCKRQTSNFKQWPPIDSRFAVNETEISLTTGRDYPIDGPDVTKTVLDICPTCFSEKLIPWFKSQGGTLREE